MPQSFSAQQSKSWRPAAGVLGARAKRMFMWNLPNGCGWCDHWDSPTASAVNRRDTLERGSGDEPGPYG